MRMLVSAASLLTMPALALPKAAQAV